MGWEKFSGVLKSHVFKQISGLQEVGTGKEYNLKDRAAAGIINILEDKINKLRDTEQLATKTSFKISNDDIESVIHEIDSYYTQEKQKLDKLLSREGLDSQSKEAKRLRFNIEGYNSFPKNLNLNSFKEYLLEKSKSANYDLSGIDSGETNDGDEYLILKNIGWNTISTYINEFFLPQGKNSKGENISVFNDIGFNRGHVLSLAHNLLERQRKGMLDRTNNIDIQNELGRDGKQVVTNILGALKDAQDMLHYLDAESSNLGNASLSVFAEYTKNAENYLVEMQLAAGNRKSAVASKNILESFSLLTSGALDKNKALKEVENIKSILMEQASIRCNSLDTIEALLNTEGSPKYFKLVENRIISSLPLKAPVKKDKKTYKQKSTKLLDIKLFSNAQINKLKSNIKKLKSTVDRLEVTTKQKVNKLNSIKKKPSLRSLKGQFTSLVSLQNLLNQKLATQVANNMGQEGALVYRTGRFANSARVEKLQMQRDGAIGIFYTYMKYPYQTFEPGFAQGSKARDPKDLITKSIRELATGLVTSRLRITRV